MLLLISQELDILLDSENITDGQPITKETLHKAMDIVCRNQEKKSVPKENSPDKFAVNKTTVIIPTLIHFNE